MRRSPSRCLPAIAVFAVIAAGCERTPFAPETDVPVGQRSVTALSEFNGNIRIGVVPSASNIGIGAAGSWQVLEKASGAVVMTGSGGAVQVTLVTAAKTDSLYLLQVACYGEAALNNWLANAAAAGYTTWTEFVPAANCTRARIVNTSGGNDFASRNNFRNQVIADGLAGTDSFWVLLTTPGAAVLRVTGSSVVDVEQGAVLVSADNRVTIQGVPYRGKAEVAVNSAGTLAGINEVPIEEYLYGVVPRELPPTVWPELEALKAQAVAARTYAMRGLGKRAGDGYDLLATTADQVYGGLNAEHPLSTQAVDETEALVARYGGALIEALYSSTSGGYTADNEEVFNSAPVPYLRGVRDAHRGAAFANVPTLDVFKNHANPKSLRGTRNGDYEADWSQYHRWTFTWTAAEIRQAISAFAGVDVGTVQAINVLERGPSGRALLIEYVTDAGTWTDTKDRIRASLRYIGENGALNNLRSTLFFIEPVVDGATGAIGFAAYGGGWGHGVGMCQTGAVGMAAKGFTFEQILNHYYRDITIDPAY